MRFDNAVTVFLSEWPAEGVSKDTVRTYRVALGWLGAFLASRRLSLLSDVTPETLRAAMIEKMSGGPGRPDGYKGGEAAAASMLTATRAMTRWLGVQGLVVPDLSAVKPPRVPTRVQTRLYADEFDLLESTVLRRLINGTKRVPRVAVARDLALLNVLGETGLRAQEVCGMAVRDVDLERGCITVRRGKGKKERVIAIVGSDNDPDPDRVLRLVRDWLDVRAHMRGTADHDALWTSFRGRPLVPVQLRVILARLCIEAGLASNRPPHAFRRYVFTEHYRDRPGAVRGLAARMGWSEKSHNMIDTYTRGVEMELGSQPLPLLSNRAPVTRLPRRTLFDHANRPSLPGQDRTGNGPQMKPRKTS